MVEIIGQSIDVCISHRKIYKRFLLFSFDTATEAFMFDLNRTACRQYVYLVVHMVDLSQISSYDIGNIIGKVDVAYRAIIIQEYETLVKNQNSPQTFYLHI